MNTEHTAIDIDYTTMTAVLPLQDGTRVFTLLQQDTDNGPPWEEWDGEGRVHQFHRGADIGAYLEAQFGADPEAVYRALCDGGVVVNVDGEPCIGIEAYIHGGERWSLPGGCQIDRQWDVAPLRAIWTADKLVLDNLGGSREPERLREYLRGCLETFNQFLAGDVWCCEARVERPTDDQETWEAVSEPESCCGIYGEDGIESFLRELAPRVG